MSSGYETFKLPVVLNSHYNGDCDLNRMSYLQEYISLNKTVCALLKFRAWHVVAMTYLEPIADEMLFYWSCEAACAIDLPYMSLHKLAYQVMLSKLS